MKKIICCFTLLFIVLGCEQDIPDAQPLPDPVPGKPFTNSIGMKLVYIPPGEFMMGSRDSAVEVARKGTNPKPEHFMAEHPQHLVKITDGFFMETTEVAQAQYIAIMGNNPSHFKGEGNPVETVSWNDAVEFCKKLSEKEGRTYRLPTEAEWEYACRAGTTTPFHIGETINTSQANYRGDYIYGNGAKGIYRERTIAVGSFPANAFGLYDMHGNVWEWCQDWYPASYYASIPASDPLGPSSEKCRALRGGSWLHYPTHCRSAYRNGAAPDTRNLTVGFRIVLDL